MFATKSTFYISWTKSIALGFKFAGLCYCEMSDTSPFCGDFQQWLADKNG